MSCDDKAKRTARALEKCSGVARGSVDAAERCNLATCNQVLISAEECAAGHSQCHEPVCPQPDVGWPRCPHCQGLVLGDECENELCPSKWDPPGTPGSKNMWRWDRPKRGGVPGDALRQRLGIPLDALVEMQKWPHGLYRLGWYDPKRRGIFGATSDELINGTADKVLLDALVADPGRSGFWDESTASEEWDRLHSEVTNPLVEAPGVDQEAVQRAEAELEASRTPADTLRKRTIFHMTPRLKTLEGARVREGRNAEKERAFYEVFQPEELDIPMDITFVDGDWNRTDEGWTPRKFAAWMLYLWGVGGDGHHIEAQRIANLCGVELVADELCPMQSPKNGEGNPEYLLDYTVDGMPIEGIAFEVNRHLLLAFPGDSRDHHRGRDAIPRLTDYEDYRHNNQNWVTVAVSRWPKDVRTARHGDLWVHFGGRVKPEEARKKVQVVAALLLRMGHDPEADLLYDEWETQVETTLARAAEGHIPRRLAGEEVAALVTPTAIPVEESASIQCEHCHKMMSGPECRNPLCPARWMAPGVPGPGNGWRWRRSNSAFGMGLGDNLREKYGVPRDAVVQVDQAHSGMYILSFFDPDKRGLFGAGQQEFTDPADQEAIEAVVADPGKSGYYLVDREEWDQAHPQIIEPLIEAPGGSTEEMEQIEVGLERSREPRSAVEVSFEYPEQWTEWDRESLNRRAAMEAEFLEEFGGRMDSPRHFSYVNGDFVRDEGVLTPRQFAARTLGLWGIGEDSHHGRANQLAERCGVTLAAGDKCPIRSLSPGGNKEYLFDYAVDGQEVVACALDLNRHLLLVWPGDGRDHAGGWDAMGEMMGWEDDLHNSQNWVIARLSGEDGTKRRGGVMIDARSHPPEKMAEVARVMATLLLRAGHDPEASLDYWVRKGEKVTTTVREAAEGHQARPAPLGLQVTEAGQRVMGKVLKPYLAWRSVMPSSGTPEARRAGNQLRRAALVLREAIVSLRIDDSKLLFDLGEFAVDAPDMAMDDAPGMVRSFSILKQHAHLHIRNNPRVADLYGAGFARQFIG